MEDIRFDGVLHTRIRSVEYISVNRNRGFSFGFREGKPNHTFLYLESGKMEYDFGEEKIGVLAGEFLYIPRQLPYTATYLQNGTTTKTIVFSVEEEAFSVMEKPFLRKSLAISAVFDSITPEKMRNTVFLFAKAYELIYLLENEKMNIPEKYKQILPAIEEMNRKYFENRKMTYYASLSHMSESNFRKLFKEYTGKTPIEYRNLVRLAEVKKMLASGEFTVAEAAYAAGFNNMSFFYEVYNRAKKEM